MVEKLIHRVRQGWREKQFADLDVKVGDTLHVSLPSPVIGTGQYEGRYIPGTEWEAKIKDLRIDNLRRRHIVLDNGMMLQGEVSPEWGDSRPNWRKK